MTEYKKKSNAVAAMADPVSLKESDGEDAEDDDDEEDD